MTKKTFDPFVWIPNFTAEPQGTLDELQCHYCAWQHYPRLTREYRIPMHYTRVNFINPLLTPYVTRQS